MAGPPGQSRHLKEVITDTLLEASRLETRSLRRSDGPLLAEVAGSLSMESQRLRFFKAGSTTTDRWIATLLNADPKDHLTECLLCHDSFGTVMIGMAEVVRISPGTGEFAAAIADDWQGLGVGSLLVRQLADRSLRMGIHRWKTDRLSHNHAIAHPIRTVGTLEQTHTEYGIVTTVHSLSGAHA